MKTRKITVPWGMSKAQAEETLNHLHQYAKIRSLRTGRPVAVPNDFELEYAQRNSPGLGANQEHVAKADPITKQRTREGQIGGRWLRTWRIPGYAF